MGRLFKSVGKTRLHQIRILFFSALCAAGAATQDVNAQDKALFEKEQFIFRTDTMPYRVLLPAGMIRGKRYPLLLFLHGSGERGNDNELQLVHGAALFLRDSIRMRYPAIVIFPQCSKDGYWSNVIRDEKATGRSRYTFRPGVHLPAIWLCCNDC